MNDPTSQRPPPWTLALERRFAILYNTSACFASMSVALIIWSANLLHAGPFPTDMKKRFNKLYDSKGGSDSSAYESLRNSLLIGIAVFVMSKLHFGRVLHRLASRADTLIRRLDPAVLRSIGYRGRREWPVAAPTLGAIMLIPALCLAVLLSLAYSDTVACYSRYINANLVVYEPCDVLGTGTPEYRLCKTASAKLFAVQMASLGFAAVPAVVFALHFAVTMYQIYIAFAWLNKQLRIINSRRPEIDAELELLEARDRLMNESTEQEYGLPVSHDSKAETGMDEKRGDIERHSERSEVQDSSMTSMKKD